MIKTTWALVTILSISFGCSTRTENTSDTVDEVTEVTTRPGDGKTEVPVDQQAVTEKLTSGLYRGGLKLAINGNTVSGYYEDASGWNEAVGAPQFSCEYSFVGEYTGSDTIPLTLPTDDGATGRLEILSPGQIRVSLSRSPCDNDQPVTEVWEIASAYPLVAIRNVISPKSYFYSSPGEQSRRSAYLVKGDRAEVVGINGEWYQVRYQGAKSTTEGWMPASAFEGSRQTSDPVLGTWLSKPGEPYEVYYEFYPNNRYKTWSINSLEPQGMTGSFTTTTPGIISLQPCGSAAVTMSFRNAGTGEISLMLPKTDQWTVFERKLADFHLEEAGFSIEKRQIVTTVNSRVVRIPSSATKAEFLNGVCPFEVTPDVINNGEGTFDILRVSSVEKGPLFYAVLDGDDVTTLVIESSLVHWQGITVGATFGELKKAIPSVTVERSEIEGRIVGYNEDFTFSFGHVSNQLFDATTKSIPDSVKIRQIIL